MRWQYRHNTIQDRTPDCHPRAGCKKTLGLELGHLSDFLQPAPDSWAWVNERSQYTVKIICKHSPHLGADELHPIWVNLNPDICVPD